MSVFGKLIGAAIDTAVLPFSVVKDVVTFGGILVNEEPATLERLKKIAEKIDGAANEAAE